MHSHPMRVIILTSSRRGTASYCLPLLLERTKVDVVSVIYSEGVIKNKKKYYLQKIKKAFRIGFLGAINGIRMRDWYSHKNSPDIQIEDLGTICKRHNIPFETTPSINIERTRKLIEEAKPDLGLRSG